MTGRLRAAWKAFCENPDNTWVVTQNVFPIGWRLEYRAHSRSACEAWLREHVIPPQVEEEVITWAEYRERQIALLESDAPWVAIGKLMQLNSRLAQELGVEKAQVFAQAASRDIDDAWVARYTKRRA